MKIILIPLVWLMLPIAFVVVSFDVAKAAVEAYVEDKLKEKNNRDTMILSKECYERGCAAYDDRVDEGVMIPKEKNSD